MLPMRPLEIAINKYIALDPEAPDKLQAFDDKVICLEITGLNKRLYLHIKDQRINAHEAYDGKVDAIISGTPAALFKLGLKKDTASLFFAREVELRGDTRLGRQFKAFLSEMDIDWEEYLSAIVGDIAANRIHKLFSGVHSWGRSAADNFSSDVSEYLQEESRMVISGAELEMFFRQVDDLRDGAERLSARIERMSGSGTQ